MHSMALCRSPELEIGRGLPDASLLIKLEENLALTMKDGNIYKNTIK